MLTENSICQLNLQHDENHLEINLLYKQRESVTILGALNGETVERRATGLLDRNINVKEQKLTCLELIQ